MKVIEIRSNVTSDIIGFICELDEENVSCWPNPSFALRFEEERMKNIPSWANWIARDKNGKLFAYSVKPFKNDKMWVLEDTWEDFEEIQEAPWLRFIKWEDKKPVAIVRHKDEAKETMEPISLHESGVWHARTEKTDSVEPTNPVNRPSHYNVGGIETIDIIKSMLTEEEYKGYLKGNILKYRERAEHKGNPEQDYAKAKVYYDWLEEMK